MLQRMLAVLAILFLVVCAFGADDVWLIRYDGVGPVKIGMSLPQLRAALHERLVTDEGRKGM